MGGRLLIKIFLSVYVSCTCTNGRYFYEDCIDNIGNEFLFMFSEHYITGSFVKVYFSTPLGHEVSVRIHTPIWTTDNVDITVTVTNSSVTEVEIPRKVRMTGTGKGTSSIHILASDSISVYAADTHINSGDAFMVYPTDSLGKEYINIVYNQTSTKYFSSLGGVALYDSTIVEVFPPPSSVIMYEGTQYSTGEKLTLTLNKYELFQIQSHDLSGTHIRSSFPISVTSAHEYIRMGGSTSKDFMETTVGSRLKVTHCAHGVNYEWTRSARGLDYR